MGVVLYYLPLSAPCRSVMLLAKELGVDLELKRLELFKGEHMQPWFLELNPQHTIPTMVDDGFPLAESRAILMYLYNKYGKDESLYPKDPKERAIVDHRIQWDCATLLPRLRNYIYPPTFEGAAAFKKADRDKIEEAIGWLDGFIAKSGGWAAGPNKTLADYALVASFSNIAAFEGIHKFDLSKYPNVTAWLDKCKTELKGYEEAVQQGADEWVKFIESKNEGKAIA